jgi:hypothetical protein
MVESIRVKKDIKTIKRLLKARPRDLLLFTMGVNNELRVGDLPKLKVDQMRHMKLGQPISVRGGKTGKVNVLMMNRSINKVYSATWISSLRPKRTSCSSPLRGRISR